MLPNVTSSNQKEVVIETESSKLENKKTQIGMKERLKSVPLWASVLALIHLVVKNCAGLELPGWADISTEIIAILTILFGAANNPTDRRHF